MQSSQEDLSQRYCEVCFVSFDRALPRPLQEGLEVLLCSQCKVAVHRCCYDFQPSGTILDKHISEFLCEACRANPSKPPACFVCYGHEGAFKPLLDSPDFIHVYCGLVHNQIDVMSYYPTLTFRKSPQYEELSNICEICMKRNAHDQCAQDSCRRKVHTYCAKKTYTLLSQENDEPHSWNHHINVGTHGGYGAFDISEEVLPLEMVQEEVDSCLKPLTDMCLVPPQVPFLTKKVHKEYTDELRGRRKSTKKLRRGGFSFVLCTVHESIPYCFCQTRDEVEMVLCQCCFDWYHQKCINFQPDQAEERWICQYCKIFYEFKRKAVEEVQGGRMDWDVCKVQLPLKLSVGDMMWVMRVVDNRIRGGQGVKMMKELSKYPLKSSCMQLLIKQQNRPKLNVLAAEIVKMVLSNPQELVRELKPRRVLDLDVNGRPVVLDQNVAYNVGLGKVLQSLTVWGVPAECLRGVQLELQFKAKAVTDQYEQIYELSKTEQPYQEVPILKQKATAYHYQHILNQVQTNTTIAYPTLLLTQKELEHSQHIPPYMLQTLNAKIAQVQPLMDQLEQCIRSQPQNTARITPLLQQIQDLHVDQPEIYLQLKSQKKLINDLQLYYNKINGPDGRDLSLADQINQLLSWEDIKVSQELVDIVNTYQPQKDPIWAATSKLIKHLKTITLEYEVKEILKRKVVKQEKLMQLVSDLQGEEAKYSQDVMTFLQSWKGLKQKIDACLAVQLQNVEEYGDISDSLKLVNESCQGLDNLGIKIQEEGKISLQGQLKMRKEELEQLQILFTEAQLQKNPLTISKLLPSLPKTNPLVKNYLSLKKQYSSLMNRYTTYIARISERLQLFKGDTKKQRKDQIKENNQKPTLSQISEFIQLLKSSQIDMGRQIKEMSRVMTNTLQIASKVRKYYEQKNNLEAVKAIEELSIRRKEVDELRKKVLMAAELNLKTELVDLYHLEILIRMKNALLTPNLELDKIGFLLKFAEEESLTHDNMYIVLKERFQTKNQRSKEVNQLKSIEQLLQNEASRDSSGNLQALTNFRRGLVLSDPSELKVTNSYSEDLKEKNKNLRSKLSNILSGKVKMDYQEVRPIYLQALKNPFAIPELSKLTPQINKTWDIIRRWKDLNKQYTLAHPIFSEYQFSFFSVEEIDIIRKELKNNQQELSTLKFLVESFSEETKDQMEEILDRLENNPIVKDTEVCLSGQKHYLEYWIKLLSLSEKTKSIICYEKIKRLVLDSYNLLQKTLKRGDDHSDLTPIIIHIEKYLTNIKAHLKNYPKYTSDHLIVCGFIDLEDYYLDNQDETDLSELVPLYKPFEDITKFRFKNLQTIQLKREESLKRSYSKFEQIRGDSEKNIILPPPSSSSSSEEQLPQVVSDNERKKIKQIFLKNIRKNPQLQKYGDYENEVKMIENQIFGEWHNDIVKYFEISDEFEKLFIKLINCPNISTKIMKKKFEFKFIQLLVNNLKKIDELQNMVVAKNKQEQTEKSIKDIIPAAQPDPEPIVDTLAGNVDQLAREDLKKEMKMLKESRESKDHKNKKKKHHKHKDRSKSPEAKFSSDSEKELPKYIESEYNKDETKQPPKSDPFGQRGSDSPLRYDPQEEELLKREVIHPKGSILKLKTCEAEIQTKKRGRMEFYIDLFTEEEHKKILQLVDPGFTKLPIRKEKSQAEMLPYIGKSKKKYRFVVGWFQAVNPDQNQLLKELAEEAVEKKKIYGWQNEHIKVHMMAVSQLATIPKFVSPSRVTSQSAADALLNNRMVFVIQYPDRLFELRDNYKTFEAIVSISEEYPVNVPQPAIETRSISDYYNNYRVPSIQPFKPAYKEPDVVYETWGEPPAISQQPPPLPLQPQQQYGLPQRVNQLRMQFNFGNFSPIVSESEDNDEDKDKDEDLAANLINAYDVGKVAPSSETQNRDKNQAYQGYYGGYQQQYPQQPQQPQQAPQPQQRPMPDNRWMNYQQQPQPPQSIYNPLNPMAGRYGPPQPPGGAGQMAQGMYKNPMMGQRNPNPPNPGQYYDPRYQGYQPPQ